MAVQDSGIITVFTILVLQVLHGFFQMRASSTKILAFLSFGKLRGSYGTTGNDQIGDYSFLSLYNYPPIQVPYQVL
jgi:hypothetical protein